MQKKRNQANRLISFSIEKFKMLIKSLFVNWYTQIDSSYISADSRSSIRKSWFLTLVHPLRSTKPSCYGCGQVQVQIHTFFHISSRSAAAVIAICLFVYSWTSCDKCKQNNFSSRLKTIVIRNVALSLNIFAFFRHRAVILSKFRWNILVKGHILYAWHAFYV